MTEQRYKDLLSAVMIHKNTKNEELHSQTYSDIQKLVKELPHGSGINYEYQIEYDKCNNSQLVFSNRFDAMADNGMYDKVINYTVKVYSTLLYGIDCGITGNFGKYQDIKEYLYEVYME